MTDFYMRPNRKQQMKLTIGDIPPELHFGIRGVNTILQRLQLNVNFILAGNDPWRGQSTAQLDHLFYHPSAILFSDVSLDIHGQRVHPADIVPRPLYRSLRGQRNRIRDWKFSGRELRWQV